MPWTYNSKTGELTQPNGTSFGFGFAGKGEGLNEPLYQAKKNTGPLPAGTYHMTEWFDKHPTVGLCAIRLTPDFATEMYGRSGFLIHGARSLLAKGLEAFLTTSDGCIIIGDCFTRKTIWASPDHELIVKSS